MSLHVSGYQGICTKISDIVNKTEHMFHALRRSRSNLPTYSHLQVPAVNLIQVPGNRCTFNDQKPFFAPLNFPHIPTIPGLGWAGIYIDWCISDKPKLYKLNVASCAPTNIKPLGKGGGRGRDTKESVYPSYYTCPEPVEFP